MTTLHTVAAALKERLAAVDVEPEIVHLTRRGPEVLR